MNEHEALGCGHFSESEWADLFMTAGPDEDRDVGASQETAPASPETLRAHMQSCAACRAEWSAFASIGFAIRDSVRAERPTQETFVDGVLAASGRTAPGRAAAPGTELGPVADAKTPSRRDSGERRSTRSWFRPSPVAAAVVIAAFAVLGAGLWSWPWTGEPGLPSTGEVLPGGAIVKSTRDALGSGTVRASSLRADGTAAMESHSAEARARSGDATHVAGRSIRVTLGAHGAVSADK